MRVAAGVGVPLTSSLFGLANLVVVVILARLSADGFASLWCFYAAIACGAIMLHMRYAKPHRATPYAVS